MTKPRMFVCRAYTMKCTWVRLLGLNFFLTPNFLAIFLCLVLFTNFRSVLDSFDTFYKFYGVDTGAPRTTRIIQLKSFAVSLYDTMRKSPDFLNTLGIRVLLAD